MNKKKRNLLPEGALELAENAAEISGVPLERTREVNATFKRLLKKCSKNTYRSPLVFLEEEKDDMDPQLGLFKVLHLMACDLQTLKKHPRKYETGLSTRIPKEIELASHFQRRLETSDSELNVYLQQVETQLTQVSRALAQVRTFPPLKAIPSGTPSSSPPPPPGVLSA